MAVTFRVLGPFTAHVNGVPADLGGPRPRLLLARLIIARGATVAVDTLLDDLYDGAPPPRAVNTLHSYISNLRRVLEPDRAPRTPSAVLVNRPPGYALLPDEVDAEEFSRLARAGAYAEALALWRGAPYEEFADVPWLRPEIEHLAETHLVTLEGHLAQRLGSGDPHVVGELETLVRAHPLREGLWELLARGLYRLGRQADALDALRTARTRLAEELGLDPGPALQRLEAAILTQDPALLSPSPEPAGIEVAAPAAPPVTVGRGAQLGRLAELAAGVAAGRPASAVISGEPGIGKTWLAEAFAAERAAAGWLVARGRCHETSGAPALWPWQQAVRELAAAVPPPPDSARWLGVLLTDDAPAPGEGAAGEAGEARFRLHRATAAYLEAAARRRRVLIVLDDLQWADAASLGLLVDLTALLRGRVLIAVTVRSGEGTPELYDALGVLGRRDALRLPLAGLDRAAIAELAARHGVPAAEDGVVAALAERTQGNPLFIREILRLAADQGLERALTGVPEGLADVLRQRLLRLPATHRAVLDAAAVVGSAADPLVLAEIAGIPSGEVDEALDTAAGMMLLASDQRFTHDLVRETVYADVPARRRAGLHLAALRALERRPRPDPSALARHALGAGPAAAADGVRGASAAAEPAAARLAYEDAVAWWRRAVAAHATQPGADPAEHVELLLSLVRAQLVAGDGYGARQTRAEALLAADTTAATLSQEAATLLAARALTSLDAPGLWKFYAYGETEAHIVRRIEDALARLPARDSELRCRLLGCLGVERYDGSADPRGDLATAEALAMARRLLERGEAGERLLAVTLNARYLGVQLMDRLAELDAIGVELASLDGLPAFALLGYMIMERTRLERFDVAGADWAAARAESLIERLDLPWPRFQHQIWRVTRRLVAGDFAGADAEHTKAAEAGERLNSWGTRGALSTVALARALQAGDGANMELTDTHSRFPAYRQAVEVLAAHYRGEPPHRPGTWYDPPHDFLELPTLCYQALAQAVTGDAEASARTYRRLLPYEDRLAIGSGTFAGGPVGYYLGLLAPDETTAHTHLKTAEDRCARAGLTWWSTRIKQATTDPGAPPRAGGDG
ncbi:BTAD domain-containing putative transcriptional regulator [Thermocatellispora tengchongensis]|uniref:BTAD domain-containing putative transcriptional regulator n=1 Tax=Thermocatellispora tengchongensis TaxID=1073253 RepID=UPI0031EBA4CB